MTSPNQIAAVAADAIGDAVSQQYEDRIAGDFVRSISKPIIKSAIEKWQDYIQQPPQQDKRPTRCSSNPYQEWRECEGNGETWIESYEGNGIWRQITASIPEDEALGYTALVEEHNATLQSAIEKATELQNNIRLLHDKHQALVSENVAIRNRATEAEEIGYKRGKNEGWNEGREHAASASGKQEWTVKKARYSNNYIITQAELIFPSRSQAQEVADAHNATLQSQTTPATEPPEGFDESLPPKPEPTPASERELWWVKVGPKGVRFLDEPALPFFLKGTTMKE